MNAGYGSASDRHQSRVFAPLGVLLLAAPRIAAAQTPAPDPPAFTVEEEFDVSVPMRDDVHLATDLYFPAGATGELPVILIRTPYQKKAWRGAQGVARYFARRGYVVAIQDVRGKGESQGTFTVSAAEREDIPPPPSARPASAC